MLVPGQIGVADGSPIVSWPEVDAETEISATGFCRRIRPGVSLADYGPSSLAESRVFKTQVLLVSYERSDTFHQSRFKRWMHLRVIFRISR